MSLSEAVVKRVAVELLAACLLAKILDMLDLVRLRWVAESQELLSGSFGRVLLGAEKLRLYCSLRMEGEGRLRIERVSRSHG